MSIGQQLLDVPFAEMVSSLGMAIAQAQYELDKNSVEILRLMGEDNTVNLPFVSVQYEKGKMQITDTDMPTSLIGAGFQPSFYQFAETVIEVKMAISMSSEVSSEYNSSVKQEEKSSRKRWRRKKTVTRTTTVDASYSSKYNYSAEGSSLLRTRLVPVPPNPMVSQIVEMRNEAMQKLFEIEMKRCNDEIDKASKAMEDDANAKNASAESSGRK